MLFRSVAHPECINGIALANHGKHLISVAGEVMQVWQLADRSFHQTAFKHEAELTSVAATPDGGVIHVSDSRGLDPRILMNVKTSAWTKVDQFYHRDLPIRALVSAEKEVMFASGSIVALATSMDTVRLWYSARTALCAEGEK